MHIEDLGNCLHTSLRKYCDSKPTLLAWNIIELTEKTSWLDYLKLVNAELSKGDEPFQSVKTAWQNLPTKDAEHNALALVFDLFSENDWIGFVAILNEAIEEAGGG